MLTEQELCVGEAWPRSSVKTERIDTNEPEKIITAGICLADISDHLLPVTNETKYIRDFLKFNNDAFFYKCFS